MKEKKRWIEKELWQEWEQGIRYYTGKPAFREAWREVCIEEDYYTGFVQFMDGSARIKG